MTFAYADPPYPGMAHYYPEKTEVDHERLIARLHSNFRDGWALSTASTTLEEVLHLCRRVAGPNEVRIAAWCKPFASFKPGVNPAYAWEPVIFSGGRKRDRTALTVRDWTSCNITLRRGLVGAKPDGFCHWLLDLLGFQDGDALIDLFPGTRSMERAIEARGLRLPL